MMYDANSSAVVHLIIHFTVDFLFYSFMGPMKEFEIEGRLTRPALPYDYTCFAYGTPFVYAIFRIGYCIRGNCTMYVT